MFDTQVNWLAILAAGAANMVIGFLWYSPLLFGNQWMKLMGYTLTSLKKAKQKMGAMYSISFVATLVTGWAISLLINNVGALTLVEGFQLGGLLWLGFVGTVQLTDIIFGGKPWMLYFINTGYQLAALVTMSTILVMWY